MAEEKIVKPGFKTTEFWMSMVAMIAGAVMASGAFGDESSVMKVAGIAAMVLSAAGYTVARGAAKKVVMFALISATFLVAGCCKGHIPVSEIEEPVQILVERHDRFVKGEATDRDKDPEKRESHLRGGKLLLIQLKAAKEK